MTAGLRHATSTAAQELPADPRDFEEHDWVAGELRYRGSAK